MTRRVSGDIEVRWSNDVEVAVHPHVRRFQVMDIDVKDLQEHNCAQDGRHEHHDVRACVRACKQVNSQRQPKRANGCPKIGPMECQKGLTAAVDIDAQDQHGSTTDR